MIILVGYFDDELELRWNPKQLQDIFTNKELIHAMPKFRLVHYSTKMQMKTFASEPRKLEKNQLYVIFEFKRYFISVFFHSYFPAQIMVCLDAIYEN